MVTPSRYFGQESEQASQLEKLPDEEEEPSFQPVAIPARVNRAVDKLQRRAELQASVSEDLAALQIKINEIEHLRKQLNNQLKQDTELVDTSAMRSEYQPFEEFKNERPTDFDDLQRKYLQGAYRNYERTEDTDENEYKMI